YFERLAPLLSKGSRLDVLLKLGKVLEVVGNWHRAEEVDGEALALAESLDDGLRRASCQTAVAEVVRKQGRYSDALELLNRAARGFAAFGEDAGVARVLHLTGTVAAPRGDLWAISVSMANLGMIAVLQRSFEEARQWFEKSMQLSRQVGDTWMVANCHNNLGNATRGLGDHAAARAHYAESLRAYRDYDDR